MQPLPYGSPRASMLSPKYLGRKQHSRSMLRLDCDQKGPIQLKAGRATWGAGGAEPSERLGVRS
jgi:hypothetical protein